MGHALPRSRFGLPIKCVLLGDSWPVGIRQKLTRCLNQCLFQEQNTAGKPSTMIATHPQRRRPNRRRKGAAAVELALSLPFLFALAFGMLEYNNIVRLRSRMVNAAYESARLATRPVTSTSSAASADAVATYCQTLLTQLGVNGATVTVSPSNLSGITPQQTVTVTITAPVSSNSLTTLVIGSSTMTTASATLCVE